MTPPTPCFDPTCDCCTSWRSLDDHRLDEITRLSEQHRAYKHLRHALEQVLPLVGDHLDWKHDAGLGPQGHHLSITKGCRVCALYEAITTTQTHDAPADGRLPS